MIHIITVIFSHNETTNRQTECQSLLYKEFANLASCAVILLQIVMVSPRTHVEKDNESLSRTIDSQFENNESLGLYVTTQLI